MERYVFDAAERACLEQLRVPLAVYQFLHKRVVTLVVSEGFCELCGHERDEFVYMLDNDMYRETHPDDTARVADAAYRFAVLEEPFNVIYRAKLANGMRILHSKGEHVVREDGTRLAYVWYTDEGAYLPDSTSFDSRLNQAFNKSLHEETLNQAYQYDRLTGLPNMGYFFELADAGRELLLDAGQEPAILFFDLKGMKFFNGKYGFAEGDKLLKAVAHVLVHHFSNENCCRMGEDHFAVFTHADCVEGVLDEILAECAQINEGRTLPIRVGVYVDRDPNIDIGIACDRAKAACDVNRNAYLSTYRFFTNDLLAMTENQHYIVQNLDRALREQWVQVYYQPIIRTANGRVCDEESLARWIDPDKGMLSPAEFIPALEDAKVIYKMDLYVLEQTLAKMARQREEGLYVVPSSINLSRIDFDVCDIVEEVCRRVDASGIGRDKLTIEVTESVVGSDFEFMKKQIERFQELGFKVWMDDFGSGYSSLDVLQSIHFDLIKFDRLFMKQFNNGDKSRIVLTELMKMVVGLGIDTVVEGVEHQDQVDFLREIGCSKLQGYYYCRPIPLEGILERYRTGTAIGFENPVEADYYATIGSVNLYDLSVVAHDYEGSLEHYFDTIPMAIIESDGVAFKVTRCNRSYRDFLHRVFGIASIGTPALYSQSWGKPGSAFIENIRLVGEGGHRAVIDEEVQHGEVTHSIVRRIATNPITGAAAIAVAVLAVMDQKEDDISLSYVHIAKALSADYTYLYYVDLDTEEFVEYSSMGMQGELAVERRGEDFFAASRDDARSILHPDDVDAFVEAFTKENVVELLDRHGTFTQVYRQLVDGEARHMSMKAVRLDRDDHHIVVGVSDVEAQVRQQEALKRIRAERATYARTLALSGDYISIYSVNLETGHFVEHRWTQEYDVLGLATEGDDFFGTSMREAKRVVCEDDYPTFCERFTRKDMMRDIERNGSYVIRYRIVLDGELTHVRTKAVRVEDRDGAFLIVGVSRVSD